MPFLCSLTQKGKKSIGLNKKTIVTDYEKNNDCRVPHSISCKQILKCHNANYCSFFPLLNMKVKWIPTPNSRTQCYTHCSKLRLKLICFLFLAMSLHFMSNEFDANAVNLQVKMNVTVVSLRIVCTII